MIVSLVVAAAENDAIGKNNQLLWNLPNDMRFFKNVTWGMPVLMGRKTFHALNDKPLPGRLNIVLTTQKDWKADGVIVLNKMEDAIFFANQNDYNELMIIGGGEIYKLLMPHANRIYITRVHATFEKADTFFPKIDIKKWKLVSNQDFYKDEKHVYDYSFQVWERK